MAQHKILGGLLIVIGALQIASNIYDYSKSGNQLDLVDGDLTWALALYGGYLLFANK